MTLSFLSFAMIPERMAGTMDAMQLCTLAKDSGMQELDLMVEELDLYGASELDAAMAATGLRCGCLIAVIPFFTQPTQIVEERLKNALESAKRLATPFLMIVPGTPDEQAACERRSTQELRDLAVQFFTSAVELAKHWNVQIVIENTPQYFKPLASAVDCRYLLDRVEGLRLVFDTANMKVADTEADPLAFYTALRDRIVRVHLKDAVIGPFEKGEKCRDGQTMRLVPVGSGIIPIFKVLKTLQNDHYAGGLVIEYASGEASGKEHLVPLRRQANYVQSILFDRRQEVPYAAISGLEKPVPRIFFGTAIMPMLMGKNVDALLDSVYAMGLYAFDCARGYGAAEMSLGGWIGRRNNRDRLILLTKCGNVSPAGVKVDRQVIVSELETSLENLQTDYVDILLLHRDDPKTPVGELVECLNQCKREGKIRIFGASNWTHQRIREANAYAEEHGLEGFSISSPNYGLAEQLEDPWGGGCVTISGENHAAARHWYMENQMPVLAYSSLGRGFFSGKFRAGDMEAARQVLDPFAQKGYLNSANMARLARAEILAQRKSCDVPQIAMRYIFSSAMNVFAIVSTTRPERMEENISAALHPLTAEEAAWLECGE